MEKLSDSQAIVETLKFFKERTHPHLQKVTARQLRIGIGITENRAARILEKLTETGELEKVSATEYSFKRK